MRETWTKRKSAKIPRFPLKILILFVTNLIHGRPKRVRYRNLFFLPLGGHPGLEILIQAKSLFVFIISQLLKLSQGLVGSQLLTHKIIIIDEKELTIQHKLDFFKGL